jgi:hypothetical protein
VVQRVEHEHAPVRDALPEPLAQAGAHRLPHAKRLGAIRVVGQLLAQLFLLLRREGVVKNERIVFVLHCSMLKID